MKPPILIPSLLLISMLACQSGSGQAGVATSGEEVSTPETAADVASSPYEAQARAANLPWVSVPKGRPWGTTREVKLHEDPGERYRRIAVENDRAAQEAWTAGAEDRLRAISERPAPETEPPPGRSAPKE
jgi:hypothetical protein